MSGFGQALKDLWGGSLVARRGWNGTDMYLFLVPGSTFEVNRAPLLGIYNEGTRINYRPHIDMRTADGSIVPWVASQSDLLELDWYVLRIRSLRDPAGISSLPDQLAASESDEEGDGGLREWEDENRSGDTGESADGGEQDEIFSKWPIEEPIEDGEPLSREIEGTPE